MTSGEITILKEFRHGRFVAQIMAFDVPEVFIYRFATQDAQKTLFQKIFFKKRLKKIFEYPILKSTRYPSFVSKRWEGLQYPLPGFS